MNLLSIGDTKGHPKIHHPQAVSVRLYSLSTTLKYLPKNKKPTLKWRYIFFHEWAYNTLHFPGLRRNKRLENVHVTLILSLPGIRGWELPVNKNTSEDIFIIHFTVYHHPDKKRRIWAEDQGKWTNTRKHKLRQVSKRLFFYRSPEAISNQAPSGSTAFISLFTSSSLYQLREVRSSLQDHRGNY